MIVLHCMDFGQVIRHRLVDEAWQYETLVEFGCAYTEWIPTIELIFRGA